MLCIINQIPIHKAGRTKILPEGGVVCEKTKPFLPTTPVPRNHQFRGTPFWSWKNAPGLWRPPIVPAAPSQEPKYCLNSSDERFITDVFAVLAVTGRDNVLPVPFTGVRINARSSGARCAAAQVVSVVR